MAAMQEARKAANVLAKAIRLGRAPKGLVQADRGECMHTSRDRDGRVRSCKMTGRRFRRIWFHQTSPETAPHLGYICSTDPKCVLCTSQELGVG
jgi:hypothetical protein